MLIFFYKFVTSGLLNRTTEENHILEQHFSYFYDFKKNIMKQTSLFLFALLLTVVGFSQRVVNDENAQERQVTAFHGIRASHGIQVLMSQGDAEALAVSAADLEMRDRVKTVVENGILKISYDQNFIKDLRGKDRKLKAYVSFKNLDILDGSSGANFKIDGELKGTKLDVELSSGASMNGKINVNELEVDQSSGAIANVAGFAGTSSIEGSSGSIFRGYDLQTDNCNTETSSGAIIEVTVNKELSVKASSGGNINYKGAGVIKNVKTSSGGNVSRKS